MPDNKQYSKSTVEHLANISFVDFFDALEQPALICDLTGKLIRLNSSIQQKCGFLQVDDLILNWDNFLKAGSPEIFKFSGQGRHVFLARSFFLGNQVGYMLIYRGREVRFPQLFIMSKEILNEALSKWRQKRDNQIIENAIAQTGNLYNAVAFAAYYGNPADTLNLAFKWNSASELASNPFLNLLEVDFFPSGKLGRKGRIVRYSIDFRPDLWAFLFFEFPPHYRLTKSRLDNLDKLMNFLAHIIEFWLLYKQNNEKSTKIALLMNNSADAIFVSNFAGQIIDVNAAGCELINFNKKEVLEMTTDMLIGEEFVDDAERQMRQVRQSEQLIFGASIKGKNGVNIPVDAKTTIVEEEGNEFFLTMVRDMRGKSDKNHHILSTIVETEKKERNRFAKDLHDGLGPLLSCIKLYVEDLKDEEVDAKEKQELLQQTGELIDDAISSARKIANNLTPSVLKEYGLIKATESFVNRINKANATAIILTHEGFTDRLNPDMEFEFYQIIHELVNNTLKHANAKHAKIYLKNEGNCSTIIYSDNGKGFDTKQIHEEGLGLDNIRQRVSLFGGTCIISSKPSKGMKARIVVYDRNKT